jgi:hypothetical protein
MAFQAVHRRTIDTNGELRHLRRSTAESVEHREGDALEAGIEHLAHEARALRTDPEEVDQPIKPRISTGWKIRTKRWRTRDRSMPGDQEPLAAP